MGGSCGPRCAYLGLSLQHAFHVRGLCDPFFFLRVRLIHSVHVLYTKMDSVDICTGENVKLAVLAEEQEDRLSNPV